MKGGALLAALVPVAALAAAAPSPPGDAARGEVAFQKCYACHDLAPGNDVAGPSLYGIVGRRVAERSGYDYSPALRALAAREPVWTGALLDRFIADPEAVAAGTSMTFTGMRDPAERADLIAYLKAQSDGASSAAPSAASASWK